MAKKHARLSASAAHRWMQCPASVRLSDGLPRESSAYAELGTMAHSLASFCFRKGIRAESILDEYDDAVQMYLDFVGKGGAVDVDVTPGLVKLDACLGGELDHMEIQGNTLHVTDFKFGTGVTVEVKDNPQLKLYALGALLMMNEPVQEVKISVVQPRLTDKKFRIKSDTISPIDLLDFAGEVKQAAEATRKPDAPVVPGLEQCRWCPAGKARICTKAVRYAPHRPVAPRATADDFPI